jgi:ribosomal protein S18 acetylase RimI-like enzyme
MPETLAIEFGVATLAEAPILARMSRDYIERGLPWRWQGRALRQLIQDRESVVLCARSKPLRGEDRQPLQGAPIGNVLGFGVMTYTLETAHLMLLAVHPHARRRGIATKLLHWLEKTALTAGIHRVELEVRARNTGARQFYREHGYQERDYLDGYYSGIESAFRMSRNLRRLT